MNEETGMQMHAGFLYIRYPQPPDFCSKIRSMCSWDKWIEKMYWKEYNKITDLTQIYINIEEVCFEEVV